MADLTGIDPGRVRELGEVENARFVAERPRSMALQEHGEDAIAVAEHLAARYGLPKWQFTLSATQANTEVIRLARELTGREVVLMFDGKYHGEGDATLVVEEDGAVVPESRGLPSGVAAQGRIVQFNDVAALEAALAPGDVALVLAEPAMTNAGFLLPAPGYHEELRRATRDAGTLLAIDETHTLVCAYAGLSRDWGLEPDFLTLGKAIAAGVPLATYGMREELGALIAPPEQSRVVSGSSWMRSRPAARCSRTPSRWPPGGPPSTTSSPRRRTSAPRRSAPGWPPDSGRRSRAPGCTGASCSTAPMPPTSSRTSRPRTAPARAPPTTPTCERSSACSWRTAASGSPGGGCSSDAFIHTP